MALTPTAGSPARPDEKSAGFGKISRSQAVSTFGVGSIFELRTFNRRKKRSTLHSVMLAGLDWWPDAQLRKVREPMLEKILGVRHFVLPPPGLAEENQGALPSVRFPRWLVCSGEACNRLGTVPEQFEDLDGTGPNCRQIGCKGRGIPVRLVVACFPEDDTDDLQPGHIDDFNWKAWAHSRTDPPGGCQDARLRLRSTGLTTGLAGLTVECLNPECQQRGARRSLEGVFGEHALPNHRCTGQRPWLGDHEGSCPRRMRVLQRGASNVYFPVTASVLSIPPNSDSLLQNIAAAGEIVVANVGRFPTTVLVSMLRNSVPGMDRHTDQQIERALLHLSGQVQFPVPQTETEQRQLERTAILEGRREEDDKGGDFVAEPVPPGSSGSFLQRHFSRLVLVHRLREVRALRGFQRVSANVLPDSFRAKCAPLSIAPRPWLPAIEVRGEGIYLELDSGLVLALSKRRETERRIGTLCENWQRVNGSGGKKLPDTLLPTPGLVMVHTLAHLLIRQLSLECGYSSASLRERLYRGDASTGEGFGVLIYTGAPGADGTLGGLVRQGTPERLERLLRGALEGARWCSSDPLCSESHGQGADALNLAACHACCLVAETSCELRNMQLDRMLLVGRPHDCQWAYFGEALAQEV